VEKGYAACGECAGRRNEAVGHVLVSLEFGGHTFGCVDRNNGDGRFGWEGSWLERVTRRERDV